MFFFSFLRATLFLFPAPTKRCLQISPPPLPGLALFFFFGGLTTSGFFLFSLFPQDRNTWLPFGGWANIIHSKQKSALIFLLFSCPPRTRIPTPFPFFFSLLLFTIRRLGKTCGGFSPFFPSPGSSARISRILPFFSPFEVKYPEYHSSPSFHPIVFSSQKPPFPFPCPIAFSPGRVRMHPFVCTFSFLLAWAYLLPGFLLKRSYQRQLCTFFFPVFKPLIQSTLFFPPFFSFSLYKEFNLEAEILRFELAPPESTLFFFFFFPFPRADTAQDSRPIWFSVPTRWMHTENGVLFFFFSPPCLREEDYVVSFFSFFFQSVYRYSSSRGATGRVPFFSFFSRKSITSFTPLGFLFHD